MRRIRTRIQKRDREKVPEVFPVTNSWESRSFEPEAESAETEQIPGVQTKEEQRETFGYNLANIPLSAAEKTGEEETEMVQAKEEEDILQLRGEDKDDLPQLIPEEEDQAPQVQKDEEREQVQQAKSDSESEELRERAKDLYEQFLAGEEAAIAMLEESGVNLASLETLSPEEAIAQIQAILETPVAA